MFNVGLPELVVIFLIVFLLFGAKALPEVARGLGEALRVFRREAKEIKEQLDDFQEDRSAPSSSEGRKTTVASSQKAVSEGFPQRDWRPESSSPPMDEKKNSPDENRET